jgi:uncharacterized protein
VIAIDTNVLVYAHREEAPHHTAARELVRDLAEGDAPWALPWPCVYEFLRVVTHPRVFAPPTEIEVAVEAVVALLESPSHLRRAVVDGRASGNLVHDAHIAALLVEHGVAEFLTADRDFSRFQGLTVRDPFQS